MFETALNFEQTADKLAPLVLVGLGLAAVVIGLFIWLGGLGFRRVLVAVVGAVGGGICGFLIVGRNITFTLAALSAVAGMIIAVMLEKILVTNSLFWRFTSALCCAALGTLLVFAGMILLLLYKGAGPISSISAKQSFYLGVFIVMTAFGTIEQLLLCQRSKGLITKRKTGKNKEN